MAKYLYQRFSIYSVYDYPSLSYESTNPDTSPLSRFAYYSFDSRTGKFSVSSPLTLNPGESGYVYTFSGNTLIRYHWADKNNVARYTSTSYLSRYEKGSYLSDEIADDGQYPANGISGSYWYVKVRKIFPDLWVNIDETWKSCDDGWVNIDGVWKSIDGIWMNENAVWKEC